MKLHSFFSQLDLVSEWPNPILPPHHPLLYFPFLSFHSTIHLLHFLFANISSHCKMSFFFFTRNYTARKWKGFDKKWRKQVRRVFLSLPFYNILRRCVGDAFLGLRWNELTCVISIQIQKIRGSISRRFIISKSFSSKISLSILCILEYSKVNSIEKHTNFKMLELNRRFSQKGWTTQHLYIPKRHP
jgi:hypothetical protein